MQTIEQENTIKPSGGTKYNFDFVSDNNDEFFDEYNFSPCNFGMYRSENKNLDSLFLDGNTSRDRYGSKEPKSSRDSGLKDFSYVDFNSSDYLQLSKS